MRLFEIDLVIILLFRGSCCSLDLTFAYYCAWRTETLPSSLTFKILII